MEVNQVETKQFYNTLKDWCSGNNFPEVSPSILPSTTFVCYNNDKKPAYSVCFYNTDSGLCWIGFPLKNPDKSVEKEGCLEFLFKGVESYAKESGYQVMFTTSNTPPVVSRLINLGYGVADENVNQYTKILV